MEDLVWIKFYKGGVLKETITFSESEKAVFEQVKKLSHAGIKAGDRVIVSMENSIETAINYLSLLKIGAIAVPVNPKESQVRIDYIIQDCKPRFILGQNGTIQRIKSSGKVSYSKKSLEKISTIIYTSGTTGKPKGVCLGWKNWEANAKALIKHHDLNKSKVMATPLPLFHCNAHGLGMYSTLLSGTRLILFDKVPENFLEIINKEKVNIVSVVPAILHKLFSENTTWKAHESFDYFLTAAAPLRVDLLESIIKHWKVKVIQGYGLTESTNFSCTMPIDLPMGLYKKIMLPNPSIGVTLINVGIAIGNNKQNQEAELLIKSVSNSLGYWGGKIRKKNIIKTGDIGYFKEFKNHRFYYLKGRLKEVINRGGEKIYPLELEAEIRSLGIKQNLCVFSVADERFGDEVALATTENFDFELLKNIPFYRAPKKVYVLDSFFYTTTGKVQRNKISQFCLENDSKLVWEYKK